MKEQGEALMNAQEHALEYAGRTYVFAEREDGDGMPGATWLCRVGPQKGGLLILRGRPGYGPGGCPLWGVSYRRVHVGRISPDAGGSPSPQRAFEDFMHWLEWEVRAIGAFGAPEGK